MRPERPAVLVIDDEPAIGRMFTVLLISLGCETLVSPSGEDALARLDGFEPRPMFVDVRFPGIDGVQFVERVRGTRGSAGPPCI